VLRALSFLEPGELRALYVAELNTPDPIMAALDGYARTSALAGNALSLASLRAGRVSNSVKEVDYASAIVERFAATLTDLNLPLMQQVDSMDRALRKCMRLESLTFVYRYNPAV
jgi:hypothetical protein